MCLRTFFKTISCSAPTCSIVIFHEKCITGKIKAGWMCLSCTTEKKKIEAKRKRQLKNQVFPENITISTETAGPSPVPPTLPSTSATVSGTPLTLPLISSPLCQITSNPARSQNVAAQRVIKRRKVANILAKDDNIQAVVKNSEVKRGPGRPKKLETIDKENVEQIVKTTEVKRGPVRPRKSETMKEVGVELIVKTTKVKRGPGRPRKLQTINK